MSTPAVAPVAPRPWRSSYVLGSLVAVGLAAFSGAYAYVVRHPALGAPGSPLCRAVQGWQEKYGPAADLQVVATRVSFKGIPGTFAPGDAVVVAPVGLNLSGAQELLDVAGDPEPLRRLKTEGVTWLTWEYAGALTRDLTFDAVALVRRKPSAPVALPDSPTFDALDPDMRVDSLLDAASLEEHHVVNCKAFREWARRVAAEPPYTAQLLRIAQHVASRIYVPDPFKERKRFDDTCAAIREDRFTEHQAHVAAVMAAREVGAPTLGLFTADSGHDHLVATYVDGLGWIHVDLAAADGFRTGGSGLVAMAPHIGRFQASSDEGWFPTASAFTKGDFGTSSLSSTQLAIEASDKDTTSRWAKPLSEACR